MLPAHLFSLSLLLAPIAAQQGQSLLPYLPEGTMMAVTVPDLDTSMGEFANMPLAKMWREEEVQNFVRDAMDMMHDQIAMGIEQGKAMHAQGQMPIDPEKLLSLRVKGGTFAVTKLSLEMGEFGPAPSIGLMMHLDFGATAKEWEGMIRMGLDMLMMQTGGQVEREDIDVDGTTIISLRPAKAPPGLDMSLNLAMVGDGVILGTLTEDVRATLKAMKEGKAVLAATDVYKANAKHLMTDGAEAQMFMRPGTFIDFGLQAMGMAAQMDRDLAMVDFEGVGRAIDALGMRSIQSVGMTSSYVDGRAVTKSYAVAPAPDRKGLMAAAGKPLDMSFLRWVPKDAVSFSGLTMKPMSVYDGLVAGLRAYDEGMSEMVLGHLAKIEEKIGFSLRDDLFGAIGDSMISWSMPMASMMSPPEVAILVKVNDEEKIVKVLRALTGMSNGFVELEDATRRGVKTYQFRVNFDPTQGMGMNPFDMINPSFSFKDGYMVAGFSPGDIRRVFKRMERADDAEAKSDIRGNKEFAAYVDELPADLQSISFTDWKANFESLYQMGTSVLALVPMNEDIPFDMSMLPDASTMTKHMFGSVSYSTLDGNGMSSTSISPFGPEVVLGLAVLVGAGVGAATLMVDRF